MRSFVFLVLSLFLASSINAEEDPSALALPQSCEDVLAPYICSNLRVGAKALKLKESEVDAAVRDAVARGKVKPLEIVTSVKEFLKKKVLEKTCELVLPADFCERIHKVARAVGVAVDKVDNAIKNAIAKGVTKASEIYGAVLRFLKEKVFERIKGWIPRFGKRSIEKRGITDFLEKIKIKINEGIVKARGLLQDAVEKILDTYKITDQKVREAIAKAIVEGNIRISAISQKIKDYLKQLLGKGQSTTSQAVSHTIFRRDIRDQLKEALKKVHSFIKELIQKAVAAGQNSLAQIKELIEKILQHYVSEKQRRSYDESFEELNKMADLALSESTSQAASEAEAETESAVDEAVRETENLIDDITSVQKRDLSDKLTQLKEVLKQLGIKLSDIVRNVSLQDIIDAMKNAGTNMIKVLQELREKVKGLAAGSSS